MTLTLHEIMGCLTENGAHADICNQLTSTDVTTAAVVKNILKENRKLSLKCLAATVIRRNRVPYKDAIYTGLQEFVGLY